MKDLVSIHLESSLAVPGEVLLKHGLTNGGKTLIYAANQALPFEERRGIPVEITPGTVKTASAEAIQKWLKSRLSNGDEVRVELCEPVIIWKGRKKDFEQLGFNFSYSGNMRGLLQAEPMSACESQGRIYVRNEDLHRLIVNSPDATKVAEDIATSVGRIIRADLVNAKKEFDLNEVSQTPETPKVAAILNIRELKAHAKGEPFDRLQAHRILAAEFLRRVQNLDHIPHTQKPNHEKFLDDVLESEKREPSYQPIIDNLINAELLRIRVARPAEPTFVNEILASRSTESTSHALGGINTNPRALRPRPSESPSD